MKSPPPGWLRAASQVCRVLFGIPLLDRQDLPPTRPRRLDDESVDALRFTVIYLGLLVLGVVWGTALCWVFTPWLVAGALLVVRIVRADWAARHQPENPWTVGVALSVVVHHYLLIAAAAMLLG